MSGTCLIVGAGPQALFVAREVSSQVDEVLLISLEKKLAAYSKFVDYVASGTEKEFLSLFEKYSKTVTRVYICGGRELQLLLDNMDETNWSDSIYPRPFRSVKILSSKVDTYRYFSNYGVLSPKCYGFEVLNEFDFSKRPVIIKCNRELPVGVKLGFKTVILSSKEEYNEFRENVISECSDYLVAQDYIPGGESCNISIQYIFRDGDVVGRFLSKKLRVSPKGYTSHIEEVVDLGPSLLRFCTSVESGFKKLRYQGFAEVEIKVCSDTGDVFLIEVNPRPCGLVSSIKCRFNNISGCLWLNEALAVSPINIVSWSSELRDLQTIMVMLLKEKSLRLFFARLRQFWCASGYDVFSFKDIRPFLSQFGGK